MTTHQTHAAAPRHHLRSVTAVAAAFALALVAFAVLAHRSPAPAPTVAAGPDLVAPGGSTAQQIARLEAAVRQAPRSADLITELAAADLQEVRETGDAGFYVRADGLLHRALALAPQNVDALVTSATLAAARHDFRGALRTARTALALAPERLAALPVLVDAQVELGRLPAAQRTLQRLVDDKPNLASYARVSYLRELHGDLAGAAGAIALAEDAGGAAPENVAYVEGLAGALSLQRGRIAAARHDFEQARAALPSVAVATAGLARVAAARGELGTAIRLWRGLVARLPLPEYVTGLGETELAAGRGAAGRRDLRLVRAEERLLAAAGVDTDAELAIFEADHGDRARSLALARRAWRGAPGLRAADALGWALARAGHPRAGLRYAHYALRYGALDPLWREHAGLEALAASRGASPLAAAGRRDLDLALAHGLGASPWQAARARRALAGVRP